MTGWTINWGDGSSDNLDGNPTSDTHVYADGLVARPNSYSITASATDSEGTVAVAAPLGVTVYPAPVTVTAGGLGTNEAGSVYTLVLQASDADALTNWTINWGDGTNSTLDGDATSATHVFASPASTTDYTIIGTASDFNGSYVTNPVQLAVSPSSGPTTLAIAGSSTAVEESRIRSTCRNGGRGSDELDDQLGRRQHHDGGRQRVEHVVQLRAGADGGVSNYTITAIGINSHGSFNAANTVAVAVSPAPSTVTIAGPSSIEGRRFIRSICRRTMPTRTPLSAAGPSTGATARSTRLLTPTISIRPRTPTPTRRAPPPTRSRPQPPMGRAPSPATARRSRSTRLPLAFRSAVARPPSKGPPTRSISLRRLGVCHRLDDQLGRWQHHHGGCRRHDHPVRL